MVAPLTRDQVIQYIEDHGGPAGLDLSGQDLSGADLSGLDLQGVDLARANLREADLRWTNLQAANLSRASLQTADLRWVNFRGTNLAQADLRGSNLWGADLTGADLGGTDLQDAHLVGAGLPQGAASALERNGRGIPGRNGHSRSWSMPESLRGWFTTRNLALLIGLILLLTYVWGGLYQATYYDQFGISPTLAVDLVSATNLVQGWNVIALSLRFLLMLPLLLLYVLFMIALLLVVPLLFIFIGDRLLARVENEMARRVIVVALFLGYLASFLLIFPRLSPLWTFLTTHALPGSESLAVLRSVLAAGSALERMLFVAAIALAAILAWIGFRLLARAVSRAHLPARLTTRYARTEGILEMVKHSRLFERNAPLTPRERSLAWTATLALVLIVPTLFTQAGVVRAQTDMCTGGQLTQVTLYSRDFLQTGSAPTGSFNEVQACLRLLLFRDNQFFVFYPYQTRLIDDRLEPVVYQIPDEEASVTFHRDIRTCLTCVDTQDLQIGAQSPIVFPTPTPVATPIPTPGPTETPLPPTPLFPDLPTSTPLVLLTPLPTRTFGPTNTPMPTPTVMAEDVFEPDNTANTAQWIGIGEVQKRNFYPEGDIDILKFNVKVDRWYRVTTSNLAVGVDTTLTIGARTTFCSPEGCKSDDIAPGTLASEVVLQSARDGVAFVTVTNRGQFGPEKTYDITVVELLPTATATITFTPSPTRSPSATITRTPSRTVTGVPLPTITRTLRPTAVGQSTPTVTGTPPTKVPTPSVTPTPRGPTGLSCSPLSDRSVRLSWNNPPAPDSDNWFEYAVYQRAAGADWPGEPQARVEAPGSSFVADDLTPGVAYEYRVRGYRPATNTYSDYSNTQTCQPFTPTLAPEPPATDTPTSTPEPTPTDTPTTTAGSG